MAKKKLLTLRGVLKLQSVTSGFLCSSSSFSEPCPAAAFFWHFARFLSDISCVAKTYFGTLTLVKTFREHIFF